MPEGNPILVIGGTGYVGGRLVPMLLSAGYAVRVGTRTPRKTLDREWGDHPDLETVRLDLHDPASIAEAIRGCSTIFYLAHTVSIQARDYGALGRDAAFNTVEAMRRTEGLKRIIYLGGLGGDGRSSRELTMRRDVARILSLGPVPVTILRAGLIIGSGSAAYEALSAMAERQPVMLAPKWMRGRCQPISIRNVLVYLMDCLENPETEGRAFDIGGDEVMTYADLFQLYARTARLRRRLFIPLPLDMSRWSAYWMSLTTPIPYGVARVTVEGLLDDLVCADDAIRHLCPQQLIPVEEAISRAQRLTSLGTVETRCFDAGLCTAPEWVHEGDAAYAKHGVYTCGSTVKLAAPPEQVWPTVAHIGGDTGWYAGDGLWRLRGLADKLLGGVGLSRGRRDPDALRVGDALDFFRVETADSPRQLRLVAEMLVWGQAVLDFTIEEDGDGSRLTLNALFRPRGLLGLAYWYAVYPFHAPLFRKMLANMAADAGAAVVAGPEPV